MVNSLKPILLMSTLGTLSCSYLNSANTQPEIIQNIEAFCNEDARGAQAWEDDWATKIKPLTTWTDAPGWDKVTVIKGYRILAVKEDGNKAEVNLVYEVVGNLVSDAIGLNFIRDIKEEAVNYVLVKVDSSWKIESPQLEPHISAEAACNLLDRDVFNMVIIDGENRARHQKIKEEITENI